MMIFMVVGLSILLNVYDDDYGYDDDGDDDDDCDDDDDGYGGWFEGQSILIPADWSIWTNGRGTGSGGKKGFC